MRIEIARRDGEKLKREIDTKGMTDAEKMAAIEAAIREVANRGN